jgi:hypothetical protein
VEIVAAATIWGMFSCFLLFPHLGFGPLMHRSAMTLLVAELIALAMWSYGSEGCVERPCGTAAETGRTAASIDIPLLSAGLVALALLHGARRWRRLRDTARHEDPGHRLTRKGRLRDRDRAARGGP